MAVGAPESRWRKAARVLFRPSAAAEVPTFGQSPTENGQRWLSTTNSAWRPSPAHDTHGQPQRTGVFATLAKVFRPSTTPAPPAYTAPDTTGSGARPGLIADRSTQRSTGLGAKIAKVFRPSTAPPDRAYFAPQRAGAPSGGLTEQEAAKVDKTVMDKLGGNADSGQKPSNQAPADGASLPLASLMGLDSPGRVADHPQAGQSQAPQPAPQPAREAALDLGRDQDKAKAK